MSEKKTFKNADILAFSDGSGWRITPEGVTTYSGSHKWFRSEEWDMEVTFTKKVPAFKPGWFLYSDVPEGYDKEIEYFTTPPPNNGWERVHARN